MAIYDASVGRHSPPASRTGSGNTGSGEIARDLLQSFVLLLLLAAVLAVRIYVTAPF